MSGCFAPAPGSGFELWSIVVEPVATNTSAGRFPDGADSDSNCSDFQTQGVATLAASSEEGATNIKVTTVEGFEAGQTVHVDLDANVETTTVATVGTAGATTARAAEDAGATSISVTSATGFTRGQTITIDSGENAETAVVSQIRNFGEATFIFAKPLTHAHAAGVPITGTGITLSSALTKGHASGAQVYTDTPTPGGPNHYDRKKE